jgi:hypothetical protein
VLAKPQVVGQSFWLAFSLSRTAASASWAKLNAACVDRPQTGSVSDTIKRMLLDIHMSARRPAITDGSRRILRLMTRSGPRRAADGSRPNLARWQLTSIQLFCLDGEFQCAGKQRPSRTAIDEQLRPGKETLGFLSRYCGFRYVAG